MMTRPAVSKQAEADVGDSTIELDAELDAEFDARTSGHEQALGGEVQAPPPPSGYQPLPQPAYSATVPDVASAATMPLGARATLPAEPPPPPVQTKVPGSFADERADVTALMDADGPDMTQIVHSREAGALPRLPGVLGDLRYVFTAVFGGTALRRRRARIEHRIEVQQQARAALVTVMAREAIYGEAVAMTAVADARAEVGAMQAERTRHIQAAAEVASSRRLRIDIRDADKLAVEANIAGLSAEIEHLDATLAPLSENLGHLRRDSRQALVKVRQLEKRLRELEKKRATAEGDAIMALQSEMAATQADREAAIRREPAIQRQLSELLPEVEALQSRRSDCEARLLVANDRAGAIGPEAEASLAEIATQREQAEAAIAACDERLDAIYLELGERLCLERPHRPSGSEVVGAEAGANVRAPRHAGQIFARLLTIDRCDETIAELERQSLEASDILAGIDRGAVFRGGLLLVAMVLATAAMIALLISL